MAFSEIGAKASADYQGDAIGLTATPEGASLRTGFQKLSGRVTEEGLWLESTEGEADGLRLAAAAVGRAGSQLQQLPTKGVVALADPKVTWTRPGMVEEYSVSVDGVRQDFVLAEAPAGSGELSVELALSGASAEAGGDGARLILDKSGRELAYSRLHVTDAKGRELHARMEVLSQNLLEVRVDDANASYPLRIDPTFSDADWVSMNPEIPGTNGMVELTAVDSAGNLYIGGSFTAVGKVLANRIAKWNGSEWTNLGSGANGPVYALAVVGTDLYAGGNFTTVGGTGISYMAKWNGSAWSGLGAGVNATVNALAVVGADLYAGGSFTTAGGVAANYVAKWNGSAWSGLGAGVNNTVNALAVNGSDLYAGGAFTSAGSIAANRVAKWTGSAWSGLGAGVNGTVYDLAVDGSDLYAGGAFTSAGSIAANRVAKWNGSAWSGLGAGVNDTVLALAVNGSDLYAGGNFTTAGGVAANRVAKWNGNDWLGLGTGMSGGDSTFGHIKALVFNGSDLYAGGSFTSADGVATNYVAKWNGTTWSALGIGMNHNVYAFAASGSDLYVGGKFTTAFGTIANRVAKWNGSEWTNLGSGLSGPVFALVVSGSDVYAGGSFITAGGVVANRVAKWNGSAWSALGVGMNSIVYALAVNGGDLYAGGAFTTAGGIAANRVAKWNGSGWSGLGTGMNSEVSALTMSSSNLYAGGLFTTAGGVTAKYVAQWNGNAWSALGTGMSVSPGSTGSGYVNALAVDGSDLYAGGDFQYAGGVAANYVAKWNGNAWSALGTGMNSSVNAIAINGSDVYAGGRFSYAGGVTANKIAKWNGSVWSALGTGPAGIAPSTPVSGFDSYINALTVNGGNLFVGGSFSWIGSKSSPYVARAIIGGRIQVEQPVGSAVPSGGTRNFGQVPQGSVSDMTFTIRNIGQAGLNLTGSPRVVVYGTDAALFSVTAQPASPIATDGTATFTVRFAPTSAGIKNALISINSDADTSNYGILLTGEGMSLAPVIGNSGNASAKVGQGFSYLISATNSPSLYGASGLPSELVLNSSNGLIIGTPTTAGIYNVTLSATNVYGTGTKVLTLTVTPPAPVITSMANATAVAGQPFSYQITASNSPTSCGASDLPVGLSVDTSSGLISGTPAAAGTFSITLNATNAGGTGTQTLTLTVNEVSNEAIGSWRQQHFGTAENSGNASDLAAPDGDGIANLIKYALLMTPGQDGSNQLPRAVLQGGRLGITFQRSPSRADATIIVEAQSGLDGAWTEIARSSAGGAFTGPANVTETDAGPGTLNVAVQDVQTTASPRFMRVRVQR